LLHISDDGNCILFSTADQPTDQTNDEAMGEIRKQVDCRVVAAAAAAAACAATTSSLLHAVNTGDVE
jgi:hypothetical protein